MVDIRALGVASEGAPILAINEKLTCGSEKSGELWTLPALVEYARKHGRGLAKLGIDSLRGLIVAPDLRGEILRRTAINRVEKPPPDAWLGWRLSLSGSPEASVQHGVPCSDQCSPIRGREVDVEPLDGTEPVEHGPRGEARGQRLELGSQRDVKLG